MRSTVTLTVTLDHSVDLPYRDAQGIADAVSRLLTHEIAADPLASARALLTSAAISKGRPTGPACPDCNLPADHEPDPVACLSALDARYHDHLPEGVNCRLCGIDHAAIHPELLTR